MSSRFAGLVDRGVFPLYREKLQGGLTLLDRNGRPFYATPTPREVYPSFDAVPEVAWRTLRFIESQGFLDEDLPYRNPGVEWDRLVRSSAELGLQALGADRNVPGGSTIATQLETFRHAPEGRTGSVREKLVQMETAALRALTEAYLDLLGREGAVPAALATAARQASATILPRAPERPAASFVRQKAANQVRTHLLTLLGVAGLYDLDRVDLTVSTTLDVGWQGAVAGFIERLERPEHVRELGVDGANLLDRGDPSKVIYSFTLMETTPLGNVVRVQTDNYDGPLSFAQASRVELGSTAKLRALVTYLEVIAEAHRRLAGQTSEALQATPIAPRDVLTRWVRDSLLAEPDATLESVLDAAMARRYSANLPFIRIMRDVVNHYMFRSPETTARVLEDVDDPARRDYLSRFADREGSEFIRQFRRKYQDVSRSALLTALTGNRRLGPQRTAWAVRAVLPEAGPDRFAGVLAELLADDPLSRAAVEELYRTSDPTGRPLNDLGYLARIHPLELWVVRHRLEHPDASLAEMLEASRTVRQDVYAWLFRTSRRNAQDARIRGMLEIEAFQEILAAWQRVGYPFDNLVPSFGTAIGSSGDRPMALAELVGIVLNGGVRHRVVRVDALDFAGQTPFETRLARQAAGGETVMPPAVAAVVRRALIDVVDRGTARRARGALFGAEGSPLVIGGKTGTGDNRFRVFGAGGRLLESRPVNRTATFAFFAGDRYFGVVTAYVPGQEAGDYRFTSALPSEVLRRIGEQLGSLDPSPAESADAASGRPDVLGSPAEVVQDVEDPA